MPHLSLQSLELSDFRCFESFTIEFHPKLTVLVAANGAGKTSILDAIAVAFGPYVGAFDEGVGRGFEASDIRQFQARATLTHEMEYAPMGVGLRASGHIPGSIEDSVLDNSPPSSWRRTLAGPVKSKTTIKDAKDLVEYGKRMQREVRTPGNDTLLPLIAYYGTGRLWQQKKLTLGLKIEHTSRTAGYTDCLDPASSYKSFVEWFRYWNFNSKDARIQAHETGQVTYSAEFDGYIASVRTAVNQCLRPSGWKNIEYSFSKEALVAHHDDWGVLPVELLSDGIRNMIGLVADIAFRATKLNSQLGELAARSTPGVVLIDEVDMHLHPKWQQTVMSDLAAAFPEMQFIVTTHSPQVLTTVSNENVRNIRKNMEGNWSAEIPGQEIKGLESETALIDVMGVNSVPPVDEARWLADYMAKIEDGSHDDQEGRELQAKLVGFYGELHPVVIDASRAIRFQAIKLRQRAPNQG